MNELFRKLPTPIHNIGLTKETTNMFYNLLEKSQQNWLLNKNDYDISETKFVEMLPEHLKFSYGKYIPHSIYQYILSSCGYYKKCVIHMNHRTFFIHLYLPLKDKQYQQEVKVLFSECVEKIYLWLSLVQTHIPSHCSKTSTICIYMTQYEKYFGHRGALITSQYVNSAFTTSCQENTNICIYRYEEWFKVLIHETFHCYGLDFSHIDNTIVENEIVKTFKVHNPNGIRVYESYCEIWGEVMNVVIFSFLKSKNKNNFNDIFEHLIHKELSFSFFQMSKLLYKLKISYDDLIDKNCKSLVYQEESHVLSYFILKTILFSNLKTFEKWCKTNNETLFKFNHNNIMKYVEFIVKLCENKNIKDNLKKMTLFQKKTKINHKMKNTGRMTIIS